MLLLHEKYLSIYTAVCSRDYVSNGVTLVRTKQVSGKYCMNK